MDLLLNWLAQGVIVAIAAAAGLRVIPPSRPETRYAFLWASYLVLLALPVVPAVMAAAPIELAPGDEAAGSPNALIELPFSWWTSHLVALGLWLVWSGVHGIRFVIGAIAVRDARRHARVCPPDVLARLPRWSQIHGRGRPTRVVLTTRVRAAAVLGCGAPLVAVRPALVEQLDPGDLDRLLVHEWAHVQRRDDLAQFLQQVLRIAIGWHPAAWWLDRELDFEREVACDQVAVRATGSARRYAACLVTVASAPQAPARPLSALAAIPPSRLRRRVQRILATSVIRAAGPWRLTTAAAVAIFLSSAFAIANLAIVVTTLPAGTAPSPPLAAALAATERPVATLGPEKRDSSGNRAPADARKRTAIAVPGGFERDADSPSGSRALAVDEMAERTTPTLPPSAPDTPPGTSTATPDATLPAATSLDGLGERLPFAPAVPGDPEAARTDRSTWMRASDAGVAIGRASRGAGVTTAGFFTRVGRKIAGSF